MIVVESAFGAWALAASAVAVVTNDGRRRSPAIASALAASGALAAVAGSIVTGTTLVGLSVVSATLAPAPSKSAARPWVALAIAAPLAALFVWAAIRAVPTGSAPARESLAALYGGAPLAVVAAGVVLLVGLVAVAARASGEAR